MYWNQIITKNENKAQLELPLQKKNLQTQCSRGYIPKNHHFFFQSLPVVSSEKNDDIPQLLDADNSEN